MNFTSQSLKPDLKPQNEDFVFERETLRGHFFAVFDFDQHDFANLNTTLEAKLETIVDSFVTLSRFSSELFLGFIAKEINSFLYTLGQHNGGQESLCSAALCLVSGDRLSYFTGGDVRIVVVNHDLMLRLGNLELKQSEPSMGRLGQPEEESAFTNHVQHLTLKKDDVVLIMSGGLANEFAGQTLLDYVSDLSADHPEVICDTIMEASEASQEDRTLVVIGGPYEHDVEGISADVGAAFASMEPRVTTEIGSPDIVGTGNLELNSEEDDRFVEIDNKLENLSVVVGNKADHAELLGLQSEVLKLGELAKGSVPAEDEEDCSGDSFARETAEPIAPLARREGSELVVQPSNRLRPFMWVTLLLLVGIAGGFIGGWINASRRPIVAEAWTVKTSANQIVISRLNGAAGPSVVTIDAAGPLRSTGEQSFSSFADVKQYIDTITPVEAPIEVEQAESKPVNPERRTIVQTPAEPSRPRTLKETKAAELVTSTLFRQGDSLKTLAQRYKVAPAKLIALNPKISRWSLIKPGQRVVVPAGAVNSRAIAPKVQRSVAKRPISTGSRKVTVEAGDTLDRMANRHKLSPARLKELNPQITNWSRIRAGQKVVVSTSARG
jgi:LysM repeat protein/serine/threonine protein phosphatase PrpC